MATAALVVLSVLAALGAATLALAAFLLLGFLLLQPWNDSNRDQLAPAAAAPYGIFYAAAWLRHVWHRLADNIPGPMRAVEVSTAFVKSQVLFVLVNLGIPDALTNGPRTATQLAAACGCPNPEWLERVLDAAVAYRLLCRRAVQSTTTAAQSATAPEQSVMRGAPGVAYSAAEGELNMDAMSVSDQQQPQKHVARGNSSLRGALPTTNQTQTTASKLSSSQDHTQVAFNQHLHTVPVIRGAAGQCAGQLVSELGGQYEYYSNSLTACLRSDHPSSTAAMVKLNEYNYGVASQLSQALVTGVTPQVLQHGTPFWEGLVADPVKGGVFDQAMHSEKHCMAGVTVVTAWPWQRVGCVVDVGGGTGGFMALLLSAHPHLTGVVLEQKEQVERGKVLWAQQYAHLLPRMTFLQGNMFQGDTLPNPGDAIARATVATSPTSSINVRTSSNTTTSRSPTTTTSGSSSSTTTCGGSILARNSKSGSGKGVVYLLHSILHNWGTQDALTILRSIRSCIGPITARRSSPPVQLLLIEVTSSSKLQPALREPRLTCDLVMLGNFGGGRERDEGQYRKLLEAAGFRLVRLTPTKGLFVVVEAQPV